MTDLVAFKARSHKIRSLIFTSETNIGGGLWPDPREVRVQLAAMCEHFKDVIFNLAYMSKSLTEAASSGGAGREDSEYSQPVKKLPPASRRQACNYDDMKGWHYAAFYRQARYKWATRPVLANVISVQHILKSRITCHRCEHVS